VSLRIAGAAVAPDPAFNPRRARAGDAALSAISDGEGQGEPPIVDVTFEPIAQRMESSWMASPADAAAEVSVALATERRAELGDYGHRHLPVGCGFCRRAVAAYR
jgi:hypothetical protein